MNIQRSLKKALQQPETVTGLDLRQVKPEILFTEIERFINLQYIDLSNCTTLNWKDACIKLSKLPKLTELKAFSAGVAELPDEIGLLTSLKKIDLSGNPLLTKLPESFATLTKLEEVSFHGCGLTTLPSANINFPVLNTVTLSRNQLENIPEAFFTGTPALQYLFLSDNHLTVFAESITGLTSLRMLHAGGNPLNKLPDTFSALATLETLWLDSCPSIDYESEMQKLRTLPIKNLNLLGNGLEKLPSALKELKALQELNINSNKLHDTRQLLNDLSHTNLKILDIRFMGDEKISLESARMIIPGLQEIASDVRTTEQFTADIASWLTQHL